MVKKEWGILIKIATREMSLACDEKISTPPCIVGMCIEKRVCIVKNVHPEYCALWECAVKKCAS